MSTSTFSYAQAAKRQLPTQTVTSQQSPDHSQTPSVSGNPNRDTNTTNASTRAPSVAVSISSHDNDDSRSARSTSANPEASQMNGAETIQDDTTTATSVAGSVGSSKVAAEQAPVDEGFKTTETRGRPINASSDVGEQDEAKRGRKPKKSKSVDKDTEAEQEAEKAAPLPKVELSDAPLPSVNVWVQRQQTAKAKAVDQSAGSGINSTQTSESKTRPTLSETGEGTKTSSNGKQGPKRDGEPTRSNTNHGSKRTAPRGARAQEKESDTTLVANNPASWPTPETAAVNLKAQPQPQSEKPEKEKEPKEEGSAAKPKGKNEWVKLPDFVPTVKFETPIHMNRGPRGGGRPNGSRSGRDATGNHQTTVSSNDRAQEANANPRTNSGHKRVPTEGSGQRDGRRHNNSHAEHPKTLKESTLDIAYGGQHKTNQYGLANGTTQQPSGQAPVLNQQPGENAKLSDSHKDVRTQTHKEHHQNQSQSSSNHRGSERGRGSGRGRGGFSLNNANGMSHYAQNSYTNQHHSYPFPPGNSRHANHYGTGYPSMPYQYSAQLGQGQRKPANGNRRQGGGRVQPMASINVPPYDPNSYPIPNAGMFPYDAGNLLQLAQQQVEYYFSVDNIVKDIFLRKHMDSQGFVPISVIASFGRMQSLLPDISILRQACIESAALELVVGSDGIDRVRTKVGWEKWVLTDMNERHPSARHDGPNSWQPFMAGYQYPTMSPQYPPEGHQMFSPTNEHGFAHYSNGNYINMPTVNGSNGHIRPQESQLSAAVPEFSPSTTNFSGFKSTSANDSEDKKSGPQAQVNGAPPSHEQFHSMTNGTVLGQPEALVDNSQTTNGIALALAH